MSSEAHTPPELLAVRAAERPDHVFAQFDEGSVTYGALLAAGYRLANAMRDLGVGVGETVATMTPVGRVALEAWIGLGAAGMVEVPVNVAARGDSLAYQLEQAGCGVVIVAADLADRIAAIADRVTGLRHLVVVEEAGQPPRDGPAPLMTHGYTQLVERSSDAPPGVSVAAGDRSIILFTSGTTGPPKGVALTHASNLALAEDVCTIMEYGSDEVLFNPFPFAHINARYATTYAAMLSDARVVLSRHFSASRFWEICADAGVTGFNYLGGISTMLLNQPPRPADREHAVRKGFGAGATGPQRDEFRERFGVSLVEVYGSTEMGTVCFSTLRRGRPGSCGQANPRYEVELHDEADRPVPIGVPGEVVVRPRMPGVMFDGYHKVPDETLEAFRNLWFHTGDRCIVDADGWFYFVDRVKDVIRRRGENISSWEVERALELHPGVAEAVAIGVPSELGEEEVMGIVVRSDPDLDPVALLDHCRRELAHFAVPRFLRFVDAVPRNDAQRSEKQRLRADGVTADTWDREAHGYEVPK